MGVQELVPEHVALRMQHLALTHVPLKSSARVVLAWAML